LGEIIIFFFSTTAFSRWQQDKVRKVEYEKER